MADYRLFLRAHENEMGFSYLDGLANIFPDAGRWRWRYWGKEALRQCAPAGILPDRANGMITPSG